MILTDGIHLVSTESARELHQFAKALGITRWYFHRHPRHPHYDLMSPVVARRAIEAGAEQVSGKQIVLRAWWSKQTPVHTQALRDNDLALVHTETFTKE